MTTNRCSGSCHRARHRFGVVDLTGVPQAGERAVREATTAAAEPFRLTEEPPLRCSLWHDPAGEDLLLICLHHISVDGWSLSVLVEELLQLYAAAAAGTEPDLPPPALQHADFAAWEHEEHRTSAYTALLDARIERLRPLPTVGVPMTEGPAFRVVVNDEDQHAIVPQEFPAPAGRRKAGSADQCESWVDEHWPDIRPLSIRGNRTQ